jgi:hypothetical protein
VATTRAVLSPSILETSHSGIRMGIGIMDMPGISGAMMVTARATEIIAAIATMIGTMTGMAAMVGARAIRDKHPMLAKTAFH